jgi:hypothetical protein
MEAIDEIVDTSELLCDIRVRETAKEAFVEEGPSLIKQSLLAASAVQPLISTRLYVTVAIVRSAD